MQSVVIDCGSDTCKAGFAGQRVPVSVFGSCQASQEEIIRRVFDAELKIDPSQHQVLLTEDLTSPRETRELVTQIMFETFNVPSFYLAVQAVLSLYASGRTNGITIEMGHNSTHVVPIWNGYAIPHTNVKLDLAGMHLTSWLEALDKEYARYIKENVCYVSQDYANELKNIAEMSYTLPNGHLIKVGHERITCAESLFNPAMNGFSVPGIDKAVYESITKCDEQIRESLYSNIVISGGSSLFKGIDARLCVEVKKLSQFENIDVIVPQNPQYASWIGGSILASLPPFKSMAITREAYGESGPSIVHRKCPRHQ